MPFKSEKIKSSEKQDRRRKLTEEQKKEIRELYASGLFSWRQLANEYGVSKSSIGIIVNPKCAARVKQRTKEHWMDYRPSKEEWAATVREHRKYKQNLYLKGELNDKKEK